MRLVAAGFVANVLSDGIEGAVDGEQAQHLFHEQRQILGIGKAADDVGDQLKAAQFIHGVFAQGFAEHILQLFGFDGVDRLLPARRAPVFDRHRDSAGLLDLPLAPAGLPRVVFGRIVIQYGQPLAGADIEPAFLRSQVRQRLRKAVGQRAHVGGERTVNDVTFQPQFAAPVVDLFLFGAFGLEAGRACRVLGQCAGRTEKLEQQQRNYPGAGGFH